ncbi:alkaline phosphatase family protein [Streptomyces sp. M600PL45_2]|uniref:Alkaline phosphatase family protein n=2 Tax=Streptomyces marispadix TaxID=2922868 RepID=A0ABS9T316_9ACTN|nr:alkaline phosphatase family protein [Streptomyces marispadix]
MPDAGALRPGDRDAHTLRHLLDRCRAVNGGHLRLPALGRLGLGVLCPHPALAPATTLPVALARAALGYDGADTWAGHQTMMGADFTGIGLARLSQHTAHVVRALKDAGHEARPLDGGPVLLVDGHVLVHDNLEADPGVNWNVSACLDDRPFEAILSIARTVRAVAPVARVIAVGGQADGPLRSFVRHGDGGTAGLDTPASGFYRNGGLRVQHLGAPLDHARQLPELAARAGTAVTLVGKAADILACPSAVRRPAVRTDEVMAHTLDAVRDAVRARPWPVGDGGSGDAGDTGDTGDAEDRAVAPALVVANVQETDLAGHQQDPLRFGEVLQQADAGLALLIEELDRPGDRLVVTADHGNDPLIGHAFHTREYVPVLMLVRRAGTQNAASGALLLPDAASLADVGATAARFLGIGSPRSDGEDTGQGPRGTAAGSPLPV